MHILSYEFYHSVLFNSPSAELQAFIAKVSGKIMKKQIVSAERCKIDTLSCVSPECNQLLIKNIPKALSEDLLVMFLEGILQFEHETDFVVKLKNACATVNFTREYSVEGILYTHILMFLDVIL